MIIQLLSLIRASVVAGAVAVGVVLLLLFPSAKAESRPASEKITATAPQRSHIWSGATQKGTFWLEVATSERTIPINRYHQWQLAVKTHGPLSQTSSGQATILQVRGGMPGHGHGLPSQPTIKASGNHDGYLVEGMRFNMPGLWRVEIGIRRGDQTDFASFEIDVGAHWSTTEARVLQSLSLRSLPVLQPNPSNKFADNAAAAAFGKRLFFDKRLSGNGQQSCATCHQPDQAFTDGQLRAGSREPGGRNTPTVIGAAHQDWFYWDGRRDSLWSQALIPFEAPAEMNSSRVAVVRAVAADVSLAQSYRQIFSRPIVLPQLLTELPQQAGPLAAEPARSAWFALPLRVRRQINIAYANLGKAIEAFERTVQPEATRFDRYVEGWVQGRDETAKKLLSGDEIAGARLFIDDEKTHCLRCHNGPMLTNGGFHNIGTGVFSGDHLDFGRQFGVQAVLRAEFNCLSSYSDARHEQCASVRFLARDSHDTLAGAFKTPTLRYLAKTGPYLHDGRFQEIAEVLAHYVSVSQRPGQSELPPIQLNRKEIAQLTAFLLTLSP